MSPNLTGFSWVKYTGALGTLCEPIHRTKARSARPSDDSLRQSQSMTKLRPTALSSVALNACKETDQVWSPTTPSAVTPPQT